MKSLRTILISLAIALSGCIKWYDKMSHFTEEESHWLNVYDEGDILLFNSNHGRTDTMLITEKHYDDPKCRFYIDYYAYDRSPLSPAYGYYSFLITSDYTRCHGKFTIIKSLENDTLSINSYLGTIGTEEALYGNMIPIDSIGLNNFKIGSEVYGNCMIFDASNTITEKDGYVTTTLKDDIIKRYVISRDHGLIYYEKGNGEIYKRDFNLSPAKKQ